MIKKIIYKNKEISYLIKNTKRLKNLKITISRNKNYVLVSKPFFVSENSIKKIILKKSEWILKNQEKMKKLKTKILDKGNEKDFLLHKSKVRKIVKERLEKYNQFYSFKYNNICIRNQKTRWGSCSSRGNLNFNYRLFYLEEKFQDYIIVHELCHLEEMNHGKDFWNLVGKQILDYKEIRKELKKM